MVPPLKFHVNVVPPANTPAAEMLIGAPTQAVAGTPNVAEAGFVTVIVVLAGSDAHPLLVSTRLAVLLPAVGQDTFTGPVEVELAGLPPVKVH